ncbi:MAG: RodZ domain-containing protein [bacterium]
MEKIGDILKKRRLEINISLEHAAEETMIASRYLDAIESSNFSSFPGSVYARGFLRRYAEYLKLEETEIQELLSWYANDQQKQEEEVRPQTEKQVVDAHVAKIRNVVANRKNLYLYVTLTIIGFLIAGGILGAIIVPFLEKEPKVFIDKNKLLSQEEVSKNEKVEKKEEKQKTPLAIKPEIKGVLLAGNAFEEVWVQVQLDSGKNKEILVKAGEKIRWNAKKTISLTIGNASAIAWKFNSKAIGTLGKAGAAKTILFTPEKIQTVIKKEQPTLIPSKDEENKQNAAKQGTITTIFSQEQSGNTTQTTQSRAKEATSTQKIKKTEDNSIIGKTSIPGNSKQSTPVDKTKETLDKGTASVTQRNTKEGEK